MVESATCPRCGAALPRDARGHCLHCLLLLGLTPPAEPEWDTPPPDDEAAPRSSAGSYPQPGDRIGRFRLVRRLGHGGMGVVFLAEQEEPVHRRVALKVIKLGAENPAKAIVRFETEREALARMDHPNVARILDGGTTDAGSPYLVMDLVEGVPITEYCDRHSLSVPARIGLFQQVCDAVQHAHQKGIIHRDLKPANILVAEQEGRPLPKVIDFGIAKATLDHQLPGDNLETVVAQFAGTPAYMSPEQTGWGGQDVDARSDIYSLGILLYELLTAAPPFPVADFHNAATKAICRIICEQQPPRPSTRLTTLSAAELAAIAGRRATDPARLPGLLRGDLDCIISKALAKDRNCRYESASGLAMDLQRHLNHEPVVARPPSKLYRLRKLVRRNRLAVAAGAALLVALVAGLGFSLWFYSRERAALGRALTAEDAFRHESRHNQEVADLLGKILDGVGPSVARGRDTTNLREILDHTARELDANGTREPETELELRRILGRVYSDLGDYQSAEKMLRRALTLQRASIRGNEPNLAALLCNLASVRSRQGDQAEAERAARESLALRQQALGPDHPGVALSLNTLGTALLLQQRLDEAEAACQQALAIHRRHPGQEEAGLAATLGNLGMLLALRKQPAEAEPLFREALAWQRQHAGEDAPIVAQTLGNLANTLSDQGKYAAAEPLLREAVALRRRILKNDHPDLAYSLHNLAGVLAHGTNLVECERLYRESLAIRRKRLPANHPNTLGTLQNLGEILLRQDKPADAEPLLREALTGWQALRDPDTRETVAARASLNLALERQGKPAE